MVIVLGAGYTGLTTAAELSLRGYKAHIIASDLGYRPPLTIVGTQSRRWPGSAISNTTFQHHDLLDRELQTLQRFMALTANQNSGTVFENHTKCLIQHCERSELHLHFEWTNWSILASF